MLNYQGWMLPLTRKCDGRQAFRILSKFGGHIFKCNTNLRTGIGVQMSKTSNLHAGKEETPMLTIEGFIAVIALVIAVFDLGYNIGRDSRTRE